MHEWSRIVIEKYCRTHHTAKSKRLQHLMTGLRNRKAKLTYDDELYLEDLIDKERDHELKEALKDLGEYLFGL